MLWRIWIFRGGIFAVFCGIFQPFWGKIVDFSIWGGGIFVLWCGIFLLLAGYFPLFGAGNIGFGGGI